MLKVLRMITQLLVHFQLSTTSMWCSVESGTWDVALGDVTESPHPHPWNVHNSTENRGPFCTRYLVLPLDKAKLSYWVLNRVITVIEFCWLNYSQQSIEWGYHKCDFPLLDNYMSQFKHISSMKILYCDLFDTQLILSICTIWVGTKFDYA